MGAHIMADTINVTIRLDWEIKENAERLFNGFEMNLSTAFNVFVRQALRQGKIPFEIYDPFYSKRNMAAIDEAACQIRQSRVVMKTLEELEAMESE
jgi:DNA-damage-inducible protein J